MKIKKLILGFASVTTPIIALTATISCSNGNDIKNKYRFNTENDNKIILQSSQSNFFPMHRALTEIVKIYNEDQKGTLNFIPVKYQSAEITKQTSETDLAAVITRAVAIKNKVILPNIVMNNKSLATSLFSQDMLLDLKNSKIKRDIFLKNIYRTANYMPGINLDNKDVFTIPYSVTSTDSIAFNLDVLAHIFYQIKENGAKIDQESQIYKDIQLNNGDFLTTLINKSDLDPEDRDGKNYEWGVSNKIKNAETFEGITINDAIFNSLDNLIDFAIRVSKSLKIQSGEVLPSILAIDYDYQIFSKLLYKLGDYDKSKYIFNIDKKGITQFNFVPKNPKNLTTEEKIQKNKIIEAFNLLRKGTFGTKDSDKLTKDQPVRFTITGHKEWGVWKLRRNNVAISISPNVGIFQSIRNPLTELAFHSGPSKTEKQIKERKSRIEKWAQKGEVIFKNQIGKLAKNDTKETFIPDGSNFVALHANEKEDKATIKFLEWLYTGTISKDIRIASTTIDVKKGTKPTTYISQKSGYIIGIKSSIEDKEIKILEKRQKELIDLNKPFDLSIQEEILKIDAVLLSIIDLKRNIEKDENIEVIVTQNPEIEKVTNGIESLLFKAQTSNEFTGENFYNELVKLVS